MDLIDFNDDRQYGEEMNILIPEKVFNDDIDKNNYIRLWEEKQNN